MEGRGIPPTAANYEIWLTYLLGENTALTTEVDALVADGAAFDEAVCKRLHESHFGQQQLEDELMRTGSSMSRELEDVQRRLEEAGRNTAAYGKALEGASGEFDGADAERVQALVGVLMDATHKMRRHTEALETKLTQTSHEVRNLRSNLERVREQAMTDALTGVANRKRLEELLETAAAEAAASGGAMSMAIADIDHFKRFNDTWGHQTGDQIIRFVAQSMGRVAEGLGEVGRYGGEEFVVVMPGVDLAAAVEVSERARSKVERKRLFRRSTNEDLGNVTMSVGVAQLRPGESVKSLVARADALLYQSKHDGRNRVSAESPGEAGAVRAA
jgi:diguanylate cyclase